jgi:hypothetical protein
MFFQVPEVSFLKLIGAKIKQDAITACHVVKSCAEGGRMGAEHSPVGFQHKLPAGDGDVRGFAAVVQLHNAADGRRKRHLIARYRMDC